MLMSRAAVLKKDLRKRPAKETYKRDLQKRPKKETCKKGLMLMSRAEVR